MRNECDGCGLTAGDLPDEVDPDFIFEAVSGGWVLCQGCQQRLARGEHLVPVGGDDVCAGQRCREPLAGADDVVQTPEGPRWHRDCWEDALDSAGWP